MRDAIILPLTEQEELVITTDNSGAIGMKEADAVIVPYETVSYFSFRVAMMECLATGARPISIVIQNFCGDEAWDAIVTGVRTGCRELEMENIPITGSTESNFPLKQSAIGLNMIGKRAILNHPEEKQANQVALIGRPLVGNEVIEQIEAIVPLTICEKISTLPDVTVWPVGSKGILHELERLLPDENHCEFIQTSAIDLIKSGGPATSFLVTYSKEVEGKIKEIAGEHFTKIR